MHRTIAWGLLVAAVCTAQTAAPPLAFEVASVKLNEYGGPGRRLVRKDVIAPVEISGTRLSTSGNLSMLIAMAYGLERFQVSQGPDWNEKWADTDVYDIAARAPGDVPPTEEQVREMLQTLLAQRFQLKIRRGKVNMEVYNLVQAAGGAKLEPSNFAENPPRTRDEGTQGSRLRTRFLNYSIAEFVRSIRGQFDRPLIDQTGLTGGYDFSLEYTWQGAGLTPATAAAIGVPEPEPGIPIVASLREQLGLRVVPAKGVVETLVVDHAERPSAN